jgi:hypothetical protein
VRVDDSMRTRGFPESMAPVRPRRLPMPDRTALDA